MKTFKGYLLTAGLFCVALALPCRSAAASGQALHMTFMGLTADASFDTLDPTGCIDTSVQISATNGTTKMNKVPGSPQASSVAFVGISQFNFCTGTDLFEAFASPVLAAGAFRIGKTLNAATLNTSTDVTDFISGTTFTVQISITWAAIPGATPTAFRSTFVLRGGGLRLSDSASASTSEPATASGSVIVGATNFAPAPVTLLISHR
jgi:hypothetical protein